MKRGPRKAPDRTSETKVPVGATVNSAMRVIVGLLARQAAREALATPSPISKQTQEPNQCPRLKRPNLC